MAIAAALAALFTAFFSPPAQAVGFYVHHHSPDAGASGAFVVQTATGSINYIGQGQTQSNIVRWYLPAGENIACQKSDGVGPFILVYTDTGWHDLHQNWNSCVTQLDSSA